MRKIHTDELHNVCSPCDIMVMRRAFKMHTFKLWLQNIMGRFRSGDTGLDGKILLK
jgi:hypothetical protein